MDLGSIIGIVVGVALVVVSILLSGNLLAFVDVPSMLIVVGGTFASTLVAFPMASVMGAQKASLKIFFQHRIDSVATVRMILQAADKVRKDGPLALEKFKTENEFMTTAFQLVADGYRPEDLREVLVIEQEAIAARHDEVIKILEKMAELAPAWGMIGTLIGLVIMLLNLSDPAAIGPAMAVALLTTFYGAVLGNVLFIPMAGKLKTRSKTEILQKTVITEGMESILSGENPRIMEQKLHAYIAPRKRESVFNK